MGVVVAARHVHLDQAVAIKFLVGDGLGRSREELVARFLTEARAAARISSDYVCRVFDVGTTTLGVPYMVMEHLEGVDLEEEIGRRGQLVITEAVDYILQAAEALSAAHHLGIIHRDIKPANLFLHTRPDGSRRVKVLDFGISRMSGAGPNTLEPGSVGTPAYMSPEQVRAEPNVDARADIWALGAILYELLTGQLAFVGESVNQILDMVMSEDPCPIGALRRDVPPELEAIIRRCLDRDLSQRFPSAATLAGALAPFGSVGIVAQLTSVQRELGSLSLRAATGPAQSVEPMVANVQHGPITQPDPEELLAREITVHGWSRQRARKRTKARALVAGFMIFSVLLAATGILLGVRARTRLRAAALAARPPAVVMAPSSSSAAASEPPPPAVALPESAATPPPPAPTGMYSAPNSVQSARTTVARGAPQRPASGASHPAPKGSVNHLLDTRD
jgi:serine/threonine-protein kinase